MDSDASVNASATKVAPEEGVHTDAGKQGAGPTVEPTMIPSPELPVIDPPLPDAGPHASASPESAPVVPGTVFDAGVSEIDASISMPEGEEAPDAATSGSPASADGSVCADLPTPGCSEHACRQWQSAVELDPSVGGSVWEVGLTQSGDNTVVAAWWTYEDLRMGLYTSVFDVELGCWSPRELMAREGSSVRVYDRIPVLLSNEVGDVLLVWTDWFDRRLFEVWASVFDRETRTFAAAKRIGAIEEAASTPGHVAAALAPDGSAVVAFDVTIHPDVWVVRRESATDDFSEPIAVDMRDGQRLSGTERTSLHVSTDEAGNAVLARFYQYVRTREYDRSADEWGELTLPYDRQWSIVAATSSRLMVLEGSSPYDLHGVGDWTGLGRWTELQTLAMDATVASGLLVTDGHGRAHFRSTDGFKVVLEFDNEWTRTYNFAGTYTLGPNGDRGWVSGQGTGTSSSDIWMAGFSDWLNADFYARDLPSTFPVERFTSASVDSLGRGTILWTQDIDGRRVLNAQRFQ